jgi:uncharacterized membrane protein
MRLAQSWVWLAVGLLVSSTQADARVVRAVLFYSPTCPHCHQVITEDLPGIFEKYGDQLEIIGVDTSTPGGALLFQSAIDRFEIPDESQAVPLLIVGETILLGSFEIPEQLPGLIEGYLAQGGVDWPDIPGLRETMANEQAEATSTAALNTPASAPTSVVGQTTEPAIPTQLPPPGAAIQITPTSPNAGSSSNKLRLTGRLTGSVLERVARDPKGNGLAIFVMIGMVAVLAGVVSVVLSPSFRSNRTELSRAIPALCAIGIGVAGYLAYVETAQATAVCGPVGDCNTVQQSEYARLFGVVPIGWLGVVGYALIGGLWLINHYGRGQITTLARVALFLLAGVGVLFSIYLTFLEPFVIGATCAWCLSSAVIMTVLLWLSASPGKLALKNLFTGSFFNPTR